MVFPHSSRWSSLSRHSFQTGVHSYVTICAGTAKAARVCRQLTAQVRRQRANSWVKCGVSKRGLRAVFMYATHCGRTTSTYPLPTFHILRKYSRACDSNLVANWGTKIEDHDVNTSMCGILVTATLQAAVHLGNDYVENSHSTKNNSSNVTRKLIKDQKNPRYIRNQLAATKLGKGQLCSLIRQFSYQMQKRTHSPSQYCVWEGSVKIQSTLGRRRSIRFRIRFNKENWIEPMWSRWSSSGQIAQDSLHCKSSPRFKT